MSYPLQKLISFVFLGAVKLASHFFFRTEVHWISGKPEQWEDVRLVMLLNHTSLYEPIYLAAAPWAMVWQMSGRVAAPGADKTLSRPIVGRFYKLFGPKMIAITRKNDDTWERFMEQIDSEDIIMIAPEGRMMRANGLDSTGKPMSIRGGIADILKRLKWGKMVVAYSGGLHHVQVPGETWPRIFKPIRVNLEVIDIEQYKKQMLEKPNFKLGVVDDLTERLRAHKPANPIQNLAAG